ncbi:ARC6/PARC6 family protein [Microseira wollei]|uniref:Serine/threonine protein kinase n=1 Tax=Microseira wollei NIES-4236 TaxID=2530354 RepID=A0AAV3XHP5_9CYAN|nr:ARC6/PARC6 family protein [Microseira wollei]GET41076.1 serine/threonine protein kinase [Microseira wollei NIES-4236]
MEEIAVTFQKHDGSREKTLSIVLDEKLSEYREEVQTFLGLPDKSPYGFVLLRNGKAYKALSENQTFREAGVKENDNLALFPLENWQEISTNNTANNAIADQVESSASLATKTINKTETFQDRNPSNNSPTALGILAGVRNWQNAIIIGGLISGAILIGFVSMIRHQITGGQAGVISIQPAPSLSQNQAVDLIERWLKAKREIFAPPYNRQLGAELTTGKAYDDNIGAGGSLDWLEKNGAYYRYGVQKIDSVEQFFVNGSDATIETIVTEERTLYKKNGSIDAENTSLDTRLVRYTLQAVNGQWKLAAYKTVKIIKKSQSSQ